MREHYNRQLKLVHDDLLRMGSRVEHALADALSALERWDIDLAQRVIAADPEIDALRTHIEEQIILLTATQAPVATDLRTLNATTAIAGELERAGDYAKGIAKRVGLSLRAPSLAETPAGLFRQGTLAQEMLHTALDAFIRRDVDLARSLMGLDEKVDALEDQVRLEALTIARNDPTKLESVIYLLDIAHTIERLADRTTNIGERVIFIVTNVTEELNA
jgi:phosphate transport system protein